MSKWALYFVLFILMVVWGFNVSAIKILVSYFPAVTIQGFRVLLAGIVVLICLVFMKRFKKMSVKNVIGITIAGCFGVVGHHFFLAIGLMETTATNAGLILGLIPLSTSILAMVFLNERLTLSKSLGILVALIGVYVIVMNDGGGLSGLSIGDLYILGAVITQAISFILIKKLTNDMNSIQMTGMMLTIGSILLLVASFYSPTNAHTPYTEIPTYVWWVFIGSAIFATGIGHVIYNYAIQQLGASTTSIFINLSPFFSIMGSSLFLGEQIVMKHIVGFSCIIFGVILGTGTIKFRLKKTHRYKDVENEIGTVKK